MRSAVRLPDAVVAALDGRPTLGDWDQALPLLTVDADGYPHVALLSRAEVDVAADRCGLLAVVASPTTCDNLRRVGTAGTTIVSGDTAHHLKLRVGRSLEQDGALALELRVHAVKADSIGTPLRGLSFQVTDDLPVLEQWDRSARLLRALRAGAV